jgi:predicted metal-dependent hydrolase
VFCDFEYKIRKSNRAKRMRISVYCNGNVVVTVPENFDNNLMSKFILQKKDWIIEKVQHFLKNPLRIVRNSSKRDYKEYKVEVKDLIQKRIEFFNQFYNFKYNKINIKNQKTRWGSCSKRGNLNFNYKILFLQENVRDYIVVHELCHLKEFNHSKNFWNLVKNAVPNYLEIKKGLK